MTYNCPNCGAPKHGSVCSYCGTKFERYQGEVTVEVEPEYIDVYSWDGQQVYRVPKSTNVYVEVVSHD